MKCQWLYGLLSVAAIVTLHGPLDSVAADESEEFRGAKTSWHGFDRYDFLMDEEKLTIQPTKAAPEERNGVSVQVKGQLRCVVVVPKAAAEGKPWSWQGYYF